jgi:hypothetical protein
LIIEGNNNPFVPERLKISNTAMSKGLWQVTKNNTELIKDFDYCVTDQYGQIIDDDPMRGHLLDAVTYDVYREYVGLFSKPNRIISRGV